MTNLTIPRGFDELLFVDFEFSQPAGCVPRVVCASAQEIVSGRGFRVMLDGSVPSTPPWRTDKRCLYIGYSLAAEMSCHLSLGWEMPSYLLDLYFEFRYLTNDFVPAFHRGLVHACLYHNIKLSTDRLTEKQEMRQLAIDWFKRERHDYERKEIQDYCREDVDDTIKLYEAMSPKIDFGRAIAFRGHYAKDVARIERVGIPIDVKSRTIIVERRDEFQNRLIDTQRERYPVFHGKKFNFALFEKYLADLNILWPRTKSGLLETKDRTFDNMTKAHPLMRDLYDLRTAISQVRNATDVPRMRNGRPIYFLPVGTDNINRSALMPFGTLSGRNAPSTTAFAFNLATCLRTLIDPRWMPGYERDGYALAYLDYGQQEFAIQAQRSGDENMIAAYKSGDPYTYYPQKAGYTVEKSLEMRDQFKRTTLGLGYGMGVSTLCYYVGVDYGRAEELYEVHHQVFNRYWRWQEDEVLEHQRQEIPMQIPYDGWMFNTEGVKQGTCFNFFMQGGGATMLRAAIRDVHNAGIMIHAPVHDALLIGAPAKDIQDAVATTSRLMSDAGERVLEGVLRPRVDVKIIHNDRYRDKRGVSLWKTIVELLDLED